MLSTRITSAFSSSRPTVRNALRTYASSFEQPNANRVAGGFKATLHNPKVSEEAKERAAARLSEMGVEADGPSSTSNHSSGSAKDESVSTQYLNQVAGGHKATISNPHTSEAAKQHAREILEIMQATEVPLDATPEEHHRRVIAGYKAALHNPRVSEEAKQHAKEFLQSHDAL
ncbi:Conidiation protein 6-domain-containing protein [Cubamyces menziesii]|uniref:Conidiation-specific protein 6 n=1 Tax=Trametes cubensis TaxID=1111947 RepID=A0AAD7U071_9APHY|nr:Conidiation protein 6-domain-containing protein [Cubamyces menziesii]KAJ8494764.1 hypothetical protein ONZ51_g2099 [Trametes cubensis]